MMKIYEKIGSPCGGMKHDLFSDLRDQVLDATGITDAQQGDLSTLASTAQQAAASLIPQNKPAPAVAGNFSISPKLLNSTGGLTTTSMVLIGLVGVIAIIYFAKK